MVLICCVGISGAALYHYLVAILSITIIISQDILLNYTVWEKKASFIVIVHVLLQTVLKVVFVCGAEKLRRQQKLWHHTLMTKKQPLAKEMQLKEAEVAAMSRENTGSAANVNTELLRADWEWWWLFTLLSDVSYKGTWESTDTKPLALQVAIKLAWNTPIRLTHRPSLCSFVVSEMI